jgi:lysozyme family protein
MSLFDEAIKYVLSNEGELQENANDPGGITNLGISLRFLKNIPEERLRGYGCICLSDDDFITCIRKLTIEQAKAIYLGEFWTQAPFAKIQFQDQANYIFDMAVNMGISPAIKCVQRAIWAVTKIWNVLVDDGVLGDQTLLRIATSGIFLMPALRAERGCYYRELIERYPDKRDFLKGWLNRTYRE